MPEGPQEAVPVARVRVPQLPAGGRAAARYGGSSKCLCVDLKYLLLEFIVNISTILIYFENITAFKIQFIEYE